MKIITISHLDAHIRRFGVSWDLSDWESVERENLSDFASFEMENRLTNHSVNDRRTINICGDIIWIVWKIETYRVIVKLTI